MYFIFAAHVEWAPAAIIAVTSIVGAQIGARYGRRLHPNALRALIVVVGVAAIVDLLVDLSRPHRPAISGMRAWSSQRAGERDVCGVDLVATGELVVVDLEAAPPAAARARCGRSRR